MAPSPHQMLLLLLILSSASFVASSKTSPEGRLISYLLANISEVEKDQVPTPNLEVNVSLHIYNVFGLSETEVMELNGWAALTWVDHRLRWKPSEWENVTDVFIPAADVWTPDIGIINSKQTDAKVFANVANLMLHVRSTGVVAMYSYFLSETPCPIDAMMFPFDEQECPLLIGTYYSKSSQFSINVNQFVSNVVSKDSVGDWILRGVRINVSHVDSYTLYHHDNFQYVQVDLILKRKPLYHIALVLIPYSLISMIAAVLFVLRDPTVRYDMSLTVLVALSVYVMIVSQGAPKSMECLSLMGAYVLIQMAMLVLLTCFVVLGPLLFYEVEEAEEREKQESERRRKLDSKSGRVDREVDSDDEEMKPMKPAPEPVVIEMKLRERLRRAFQWRRRHDFISLVVYVVASFVSAIICLVIIPYSVPSKPID